MIGTSISTRSHNGERTDQPSSRDGRCRRSPSSPRPARDASAVSHYARPRERCCSMANNRDPPVIAGRSTIVRELVTLRSIHRPLGTFRGYSLTTDGRWCVTSRERNELARGLFGGRPSFSCLLRGSSCGEVEPRTLGRHPNTRRPGRSLIHSVAAKVAKTIAVRTPPDPGMDQRSNRFSMSSPSKLPWNRSMQKEECLWGGRSASMASHGTT